MTDPFRELLPDQVRLLGPAHPGTHPRQHCVLGRRVRGTGPGALGLFGELLPDRTRVLGPDHPETLTTRSDVVYWTENLPASAQHPEGTIEAKDPGNTGVLPWS